MPQPDWSRGDLVHRMEVRQVDPLNLKTVRGSLEEPVGGELDLDYYGDTRMAATVEEFGYTWDGSSALRIVHIVSDWTGDLFTETLFTGYVTRVNRRGNMTSYELASTLHGLETNVTPGAFSISKSSKALDVVKHIFKIVSRPYSIDATATDHLFSGDVVYEAGSTYLSILFDLMDRSGNRISTDANGITTVKRYTRPSKATPDWDESTDDARTLIIGAPEYSDGSMEAPERTIVHAEQDGQAITVVSLAPEGTFTRHSVRGYCIDDYHDESDLSPFTRETAQKLCDTYLANALEPDREMYHGMMYRPLREGMVERLADGGTTRRWQVADAVLDLAAWTWEINFKGGW